MTRGLIATYEDHQAAVGEFPDAWPLIFPTVGIGDSRHILAVRVQPGPEPRAAQAGPDRGQAARLGSLKDTEAVNKDIGMNLVRRTVEGWVGDSALRCGLHQGGFDEPARSADFFTANDEWSAAARNVEIDWAQDVTWPVAVRC
jgi:hypothetical protein